MAWLYRILEIPWIYALSQAVLAPGANRLEPRFLGDLYETSSGHVLEVGCGLRPMAPLRHGLLVGVDINAAYVAAYAGHVTTDPGLVASPPPGMSRLGYVASADHLPFADGSFHEARCRGLLHHLSADVATLCVQEMWRCLEPGGRLFIMDNVWPLQPWRRPLAWLIRRLDRGRFVRTEADLIALVRAASREDAAYFRYTYTYNGLEALCITATRP